MGNSQLRGPVTLTTIAGRFDVEPSLPFLTAAAISIVIGKGTPVRTTIAITLIFAIIINSGYYFNSCCNLKLLLK